MGSRSLRLVDLLRASWVGVVEQCKAAPGAAFALAFLESIGNRCKQLRDEELRDLHEQAQNLRAEDIRQTLGDLIIEGEEVRKRVEQLSMDLVARFVETRSMGAGIAAVEGSLVRLQSTSDEILLTTRTSSQDIAGIRKQLGEIDARLSDGHVGTDGFHGEIDKAAAFLSKRQPDVALGFLQDLRSRYWDRMDARERYRVKTNMGHAYRQKDDLQNAAQHFLEAHAHQTGDVDAEGLRLEAYILLDRGEDAKQLAGELRAKFPQSAKVASLWVRLHTEHISVDEAEAQVGPALCGNWEVAASLADMARFQGKLEHAERLAQAAAASKPDEAALKGLLAEIMLERDRRGRQPGRLVSAELDVTRVREAIKLLSDTIDDAGEHAPSHWLSHLLVTRGVAHALLRDRDSAGADFQRAFSLRPDCPEARFYLAVFHEEGGGRNEAIRLLSSARDEHRPLTMDIFLAELLWKRNEKADRDLALQMLNDRWPHWPEQEVQTRLHFVDCLVRLYSGLDQYQDALAMLARQEVQQLPTTSALSWTARVRLDAGSREDALKDANECARHVSSDTPVPDVVRLAGVFRALGEYPRAKQLLAKIVPPDSVSGETYWLLECAIKSKDDRFVMDFCEQLRENGIYDVQCLDAEVNALVEYNAYEKAVGVLRESVERTAGEPAKRHLRARLSQIALHLGMEAAIESDPHKLPSVEEAGTQLGRVVVHVLLHGHAPIDAVKFAYELYRRNPEDFDACSAVIDSMGLFYHIDPGIETSNQATVGSAVRYRDDATGQEDWCIIEDLPEPKATLREFSPEHALSVALLGKRVGDTFEMPGPQRSGVILAVSSKYLYRWHECAEEMSTKHPAHAWVWTYSAAHDPELSHLTKIVKSRHETVEVALAAYREQPVPIWLLSRRLGKTTFEIVQAVAQQADLPLRCCSGNQIEIGQAARALQGVGSLVVDITALGTLRLLDAIDDVAAWPIQLLLTHGAYEELREALRSLSMKPTDYAILVRDGDKERVGAVPAPDDAGAQERLRAFCEGLPKVMQLIDGTALADVEQATREKLVRYFGQPTAESIAAAVTRSAPLWVDDAAASAVGRELTGLRGVWTQAVFDHALRAGWIPASRFCDVTFDLLKMGYHRTLITPELIHEAIRRAGSSPDAYPLKGVLDQFADGSTVPQALFFLAGDTIRHAWQNAMLDRAAEAVTIRILERLASRKQGAAIIRALARQLEGFFGLDAPNASRAAAVVQTWLRVSKRVVLP
ncbi:MAG TPA: hypothetical protein VNE39_16835 [Planctomycetota bacterium]|nr:hypothetical protein [Planctomycetota bacterium]